VRDARFSDSEDDIGSSPDTGGNFTTVEGRRTHDSQGGHKRPNDMSTDKIYRFLVLVFLMGQKETP
jgi:hypothetical protein